MTLLGLGRQQSLASVRAVTLVVIATFVAGCTKQGALPPASASLRFPMAPTGPIGGEADGGTPLPVGAATRSPAAAFCDAWEAAFDASLEGDGAASSFDAFNRTPAGKAFLAAYNKADGKGASDDEACEAAYAVASRIGNMP